MLKNSQMIENRFLRWHKARQIVQKINEHLEKGGLIMIGTYTKSWQYSLKTGIFKATKVGAYVKRGKSWDCIDHCAVIFSKIKNVHTG